MDPGAQIMLLIFLNLLIQLLFSSLALISGRIAFVLERQQQKSRLSYVVFFPPIFWILTGRESHSKWWQETPWDFLAGTQLVPFTPELTRVNIKLEYSD